MTDPAATLDDVRQAASDRRDAEFIYRSTLKRAHREGIPLRTIAFAAGISATRVHAIIREP